MKPLLSIIIPFFGKADKPLLERCLTSVHSQGVEKELYEVIIPDDEGQGVYFARNKGVESARGAYLFFVDADDYLFPETLQTCMQILAEHQPDMLSFQFERIKKGQEALPVKQPALSIKQYTCGADYMLYHNFFGAVWRLIIRKEIITENSLCFFLRKHHQDEAFSALAYFYAQKVVDISLTVYAYCQQKDSLTSHTGKEERKERMGDFYDMLVSLGAFYKRNSRVQPIQRCALERRIHFLTIDFLAQLFRNRCSAAEFRQQIKSLKEKEFLPLPYKDYSFKYKLARLFINLL